MPLCNWPILPQLNEAIISPIILIDINSIHNNPRVRLELAMIASLWNNLHNATASDRNQNLERTFFCTERTKKCKRFCFSVFKATVNSILVDSKKK